MRGSSALCMSSNEKRMMKETSCAKRSIGRSEISERETCVLIARRFAQRSEFGDSGLAQRDGLRRTRCASSEATRCSSGCGGRRRETMASMTNAFASAKMKIRRARRGDAERIAQLSGELGYPASAAQVATRLRQLTPVSKHAVFVAESPDAATGVVGWVHVSVAHLLESDIRAEVNGLVVAEGQRSAGAGAKLLEAAEEWARRRGCRGMNVRSNVIRERAHGFYERNGYEHYKTQKAFRKAL